MKKVLMFLLNVHILQLYCTLCIYTLLYVVGAPDCFFYQSRLRRIEIVAKIKVETI